MSVCRIAVSSVLALALAAIPQLALAATTSYTDAVVGREFFATPTVGAFAGTATGDLPGSWFAVIEHTPLPAAIINGGQFALATRVAGQPATVTGTFSGGAVTQTGGFIGCQNQTYAVEGTLENVGPGSGSGTGTFSAVLTHLRTSLFGRCVTYGAQVVGTVNLTF